MMEMFKLLTPEQRAKLWKAQPEDKITRDEALQAVRKLFAETLKEEPTTRKKLQRYLRVILKDIWSIEANG